MELNWNIGYLCCLNTRQAATILHRQFESDFRQEKVRKSIRAIRPLSNRDWVEVREPVCELVQSTMVVQPMAVSGIDTAVFP